MQCRSGAHMPPDTTHSGLKPPDDTCRPMTSRRSLTAHLVHHFKKVLPSSAQVCLHCANVCQDPWPISRQKRCNTPSHFIHRLFDGRRGRDDPPSMASACHSESRQTVTRQIQASTGLLATWPAQFHFDNQSASTQFRTPAPFAKRSA